MISRADITKLAELARIHIDEEEIDTMRGEIDSILAYVGQVKEVAKSIEKTEGALLSAPRNVMRADDGMNEPGECTDVLVKEMPHSEKGFLKVKKIL